MGSTIRINCVGRNGAPELNEAGREVNHTEGSGGGLEQGFEDIRVRLVALCADLAAGGTYAEAAAVLAVKESGKYGFSVKTRQAAPNYFASIVY